MNRLFFLFILMLLTSCATVSRPEKIAVSASAAPVVSPVLEQGMPRTVKRKVAIARFTNETSSAQSFLVDRASADRMGKQASDILAASLTETGKFILLERIDGDKLERELTGGGIKRNNLSADYLILGSITEYGRKEVGDVGIFSRTRRQVVTAKVMVRVVEVATGVSIYAEQGYGEAFSETGSVGGIGTRAGYDFSLKDKAIGAAIQNLSSNIAERMLERPWQGYILRNKNGVCVLSGGRSQNINVGDTFAVYRKGEKVINPQTGMEIALPGTQIAVLKVNQTSGDSPENEVSLCSVISGQVPESQGLLEQIYVREEKQ